MGHPARIRVSDAEREAVVAHLGHATSEGRLTLDEFETRSRRAYASRTRFELHSLVDDLPPPAGARQAASPADSAGSASTMALIFGVLSLPLASCLPLGMLSAVLGVLLALVALGSGRHTASQRTMARVGLVCGGLGILVGVGQLLFGLSIS